MKIREIKKRALSALDSNPLSDKFIFFAFLVRITLTLLCIISITFTFVLRDGLNLQNPSYILIFCVGIFINIIVNVLCSYSIEKKLLNNSKGEFDFDLKEFSYYVEDKRNFIGPIALYVLQNLIVVSWTAVISFIAKMIENVEAATQSNSNIFALLAMLIVSIVTVIFTIYLVLSLSMSVYIKIENPNKKAIDCIKESYAMMDGNIFKFFLLKISFIGWFALSFLTLGMIYPFVLVYFHASSVEFYKNIKESEKVDENLCEDNDIKDIYTLDIDSNETSFESESLINEQGKNLKYRSFYLLLTVILSIITFIGMNYYNNKELINIYINTIQPLISKINFNLSFVLERK